LIYRALADCVVIVHAAFVVFVVFGWLLVYRSPRLAWLHAPAGVWGALIEFGGWACPLTPLENALRTRGGKAGYSGGFIEHYVLPLVYPAGLTRNVQLVLGTLALALNIVGYAVLIARRRALSASPNRN
jgi:hypothetical protein